MKIKQKILITGGEGVVANYVKNSLRSKYLIFNPSHKQLDITNAKVINKYFLQKKPDIVIHLAAKTNVDDCEIKAKEAYLVNSEGTKKIALACKKYKSFMIYISTSAVFNGEKRHFFEYSNENPINIYGKSKLLGEMHVKKILNKYLIIRAGWMIGGGKQEKKFISYIIRQRKSKKTIEAVNDRFGTITYAKDLADFIKLSLKNNRSGLYHFGSKGAPSRYDIAKKVVQLMGGKTKVIPVKSDKFMGSFFAPRPKFEVILSKKISYKNNWETSVENYLKNELL